jgi:hypothetical protein
MQNILTAACGHCRETNFLNGGENQANVTLNAGTNAKSAKPQATFALLERDFLF